jgi:hypothetical protein
MSDGPIARVDTGAEEATSVIFAKNEMNDAVDFWFRRATLPRDTLSEAETGV